MRDGIVVDAQSRVAGIEITAEERDVLLKVLYKKGEGS
jgi:hypothetical protein